MNILLSCVGRRVELIECFRQDARALGLPLRVIAADTCPSMSAACQVADCAVAVPRCDAASFMPAMLELCSREQVDLLVPTTDMELAIYATHKDDFEACGTSVVVSSMETIRLAKDKLRTASVLAAWGVAAPTTVLTEHLWKDPAGVSWPVVIKPRSGSNSKGLTVVESPSQLAHFGGSSRGFVCQPRIEGREYTVNMYVDGAGRLRNVTPHWRYEVRGGSVTKAIIESRPGIDEIAAQIAGGLNGAYGPLCFQVVVDESEKPWVIDINPRFGGGFPIAHRAGAAYSRWLLEEYVGLSPQFNVDTADGLVMLRYDKSIFLAPGE